MKRSALWKLVAVFLALALVAAACGDDDDDTASGDDGAADDGAADDGGEEPMPDLPVAPDRFQEMDFSDVTLDILTPETASEADGFVAGLQPFIDATGVEINLNSTRDATTVLNLALEGGDPPDLVAIPQPARLVEFCANGDAVPIPDDTIALLEDQYTDAWWDLGSAPDGTRCGVPEKADVKSLVWYNTALFEDNGWEVPTTWDEMESLMTDMKAAGVAPFCIGIESSDATGWVFTDWMEDFMLRIHGPEVYDQWVSHEIPFNDPRVVEVAEFVGDIWFDDDNVFGGRANIATTNFRDVAAPHIAGECAMMRNASFAGAFYTENGVNIGPGEPVDVFYLPPIGDEFGSPVLSAGVLFAAFNDDPATLAMLDFLGTTAHQEARFISQGGGYFSPNLTFDESLLEPVEVAMLDILFEGSSVRFDGSDNMPGEVGGGSFWREGTDYVSGVSDVQTFVDNVEDSWPTE